MMERSEILTAMGELKLYGTVRNFVCVAVSLIRPVPW
jgi:hypothetical protein